MDAKSNHFFSTSVRACPIFGQPESVSTFRLNYSNNESIKSSRQKPESADDGMENARLVPRR
jgi:hypothetical protein